MSNNGSPFHTATNDIMHSRVLSWFLGQAHAAARRHATRIYPIHIEIPHNLRRPHLWSEPLSLLSLRFVLHSAANTSRRRIKPCTKGEERTVEAGALFWQRTERAVRTNERHDRAGAPSSPIWCGLIVSFDSLRAHMGPVRLWRTVHK
jgi:hypothetical protein